MRIIILTCIFFLKIFPSIAQSVLWEPHAGFMEIGKKVSILEDPNGILDITQVSDTVHEHSFIQSEQSILHFGFTNSFFWIRFTLHNPTKDSLWIALNHAFIPLVTLYYLDSDNHWKHVQSGFTIPLDKKLIIDHEQVFPLASGQREYYLRIKPYVHAIPINIWEKNTFQLQAARQKIFFGIYAGILLFAILVNFFLFLAFRKLYYLNYIALVFFYILTSALVMEGYAVYFFPKINLMYWYKIIPVLDMPALLLYCISFLEIKKYNSKLYFLSLAASFFFIIYLAFLHFLPLLPVLIINQIFALGVFVLAIIIGIDVGRKGNRLGYYFAMAYSIWFILIGLEVVYIQFGYPRHISPISYVSTAIFIEALLLAMLLAKRFQLDKRKDQQKHLEMQVRMNQMSIEYENEMLNTKLEIQEQTFQYISQEIHDNIGQVLSLAKLHLATMDSSNNAELDIKIQDSKNLVAKAIQDLRDISHSLNRDYISEIGLIKAIVYELEIIKKSGQYDTRFTLTGEEYKLDAQKELILFRITQEVLNNILKHAKAKIIQISAKYQAEGIIFTINDDGVGFDVKNLPRDTFRLGLKNMYNRAKMIGAELFLSSESGKGTIVTIKVPAQNFKSTNV